MEAEKRLEKASAHITELSWKFNENIDKCKILEDELRGLNETCGKNEAEFNTQKHRWKRN